MASCYQLSSLLFLSLTSTERLVWSSTSQSLMSFEINWWSALPSSQRARTRTGESPVTLDFEEHYLNIIQLFCYCFPSASRYRKLEELLEKSFPLVKMPSIQPVVMQVLKHLPKASVYWCCLFPAAGWKGQNRAVWYTSTLLLSQ